MTFVFNENNAQDLATQKDQAKINRMRQNQEARRDRILNNRTRTIGIDVNALNAQVKEQQHQKEIEHEKLRLESK